MPMYRPLSGAGFAYPLDELRDELDRLWTSLTAAPPLHGWGVRPGSDVFPAVNVSESDDCIAIEAELPTKSRGFTLGESLDWKWEFMIGGVTLSLKDLERLSAKRSPLVQHKGAWIELRPADLKYAERFCSAKPGLSLDDALRLTATDGDTLMRLPVHRFEGGPRLQAVLEQLRRQQVSMLFAEQLPAGKALQRVSSLGGVPIAAAPLVADGLAAEPDGNGNLVATLAANTCLIVNGLGGRCDPSGEQALNQRWKAI